MYLSGTKLSLVLVAFWIAVAILTGCNAGKDKPATAAKQGNFPPSSQSTNSNSEKKSVSMPADQEQMIAQKKMAEKLLLDGNNEEAFQILETMAAQVPKSEAMPQDLKGDLLKAHTGYISQIIARNDIPDPVKNHLYYSHYSRILQLDPENAEAKSGFDNAKTFFESNNLPLPDKINPTETIAEAIKLLEKQSTLKNPTP
jgi:hypothetical protein